MHFPHSHASDKQSIMLFVVEMIEKLKAVLCSCLYSNKLGFIAVNQEELCWKLNFEGFIVTVPLCSPGLELFLQ